MFPMDYSYCRLQREYVIQVARSSVPNQPPRKRTEGGNHPVWGSENTTESRVISVTCDQMAYGTHLQAWLMFHDGRSHSCPSPLPLPGACPHSADSWERPLWYLARSCHRQVFLLVQQSGGMLITGQGVCEPDQTWPFWWKGPALNQEVLGQGDGGLLLPCSGFLCKGKAITANRIHIHIHHCVFSEHIQHQELRFPSAFAV